MDKLKEFLFKINNGPSRKWIGGVYISFGILTALPTLIIMNANSFMGGSNVNDDISGINFETELRDTSYATDDRTSLIQQEEPRQRPRIKASKSVYFFNFLDSAIFIINGYLYIKRGELIYTIIPIVCRGILRFIANSRSVVQ